MSLCILTILNMITILTLSHLVHPKNNVTGRPSKSELTQANSPHFAPNIVVLNHDTYLLYHTSYTNNKVHKTAVQIWANTQASSPHASSNAFLHSYYTYLLTYNLTPHIQTTEFIGRPSKSKLTRTRSPHSAPNAFFAYLLFLLTISHPIHRQLSS